MATPLPPFSFDSQKQAELQILSDLESMLCQSDICLLPIVERLEAQCEECINVNHKAIIKICKKILKYIDKKQTEFANDIEYVCTKILSWLYYNQESMHLVLTQICIKAGLIRVGGDICDVLSLAKCDIGPKEKCPELHIDLSMLGSFFERLIKTQNDIANVLREIRNRLPPLPIEEPYETETEYADPEYTLPEATLTKGVELFDIPGDSKVKIYDWDK